MYIFTIIVNRENLQRYSLNKKVYILELSSMYTIIQVCTLMYLYYKTFYPYITCNICVPLLMHMFLLKFLYQAVIGILLMMKMQPKLITMLFLLN